MKTYNLFPKKIVVGDTLRWSEEHPDFPTSLFSLRYSLVNSTGKLSLESAPKDNCHTFSFTPAESTTPGKYHYQLQAIKNGDREQQTLATGVVELKPNFAAMEKHDPRPWLDKAIEAVELSLVGRASSVQLAMDIDGTRIEHMSHLDQEEFLGRLYKRRAARERGRKLAQGKSPFLAIQAEF